MNLKRRAIKSVMDEEPLPEILLDNPLFQKLQNDVKLCDFSSELFNAEGRAEGLAEVRAEGLAEARAEAALKIAELEARIKELERNSR